MPTKQKRRRYTAGQQTATERRHLGDEDPASDISDEPRIQPRAMWNLPAQRLGATASNDASAAQPRPAPTFPLTVERDGVLGFNPSQPGSAEPAEERGARAVGDPRGAW